MAIRAGVISARDIPCRRRWRVYHRARPRAAVLRGRRRGRHRAGLSAGRGRDGSCRRVGWVQYGKCRVHERSAEGVEWATRRIRGRRREVSSSLAEFGEVWSWPGDARVEETAASGRNLRQGKPRLSACCRRRQHRLTCRNAIWPTTCLHENDLHALYSTTMPFQTLLFFGSGSNAPFEPTPRSQRSECTGTTPLSCPSTWRYASISLTRLLSLRCADHMPCLARYFALL